MLFPTFQMGLASSRDIAGFFGIRHFRRQHGGNWLPGHAGFGTGQKNTPQHFGASPAGVHDIDVRDGVEKNERIGGSDHRWGDMRM
jgi:hypothetical protein